ncbi:MAG TPA: DUF2065 domain-containing protein [Syntrophales bacterium]|nr:DUF2065 domain-containing protein [Syntrophales bacterium]HQN79322.1 DUF2065 domain-containing protein [Syntrophales bacterium]HQQ28494.1 DUF2065 domain-containing protein [Syntrophales bacterium]
MELFLCALGLVLFLEGLPWFISPERMKSYLLKVMEFSDGQLRVFGLLAVLGGLVLVFFARRG